MLNITVPDEMAAKIINRETVSFYDMCLKKNMTNELTETMAREACEAGDERFCLPETAPRCQSTFLALDFIYERSTDSYNLDHYSSDIDLIRKLQSGKGDEIFRYQGS